MKFNPDTSNQLSQPTFISGKPDCTNLSELSKNNTNNLYNTSLGNAGIGTSSTTTYKLNVNGSLNLTLLYQAGILINFANFAADSELTSGLALKQDILTFTAPLIKSGTNVSINLSSYSTTGNDPNFY